MALTLAIIPPGATGGARVAVTQPGQGIPVVGAANSAPADHSANAAAVSGTLIATVLRNTARNNLVIQNQSGANVQLVIDDGVAGISGPTGTTGTQTVFVIAGQTGGNQGRFDLPNFIGRARVYGATAAAVAITEL